MQVRRFDDPDDLELSDADAPFVVVLIRDRSVLRPAWSRDHLELDKAEVANLLLRDFLALLPVRQKQPPAYIDAHRLRYALVETPLGQPVLQGADPCLLAAGDWCLAPRVEAAFESGQAAARGLLSAGFVRAQTVRS